MFRKLSSHNQIGSIFYFHFFKKKKVHVRLQRTALILIANPSIQILDLYIDNLLGEFCRLKFQQTVGILIANNCPPLLNLPWHSYEPEFIQNSLKEKWNHAKFWNYIFKCIDDALSLNGLYIQEARSIRVI